MNLVLLSGGSGKRLWPLSNDVRSKQFLKLFRSEDGYESMVQKVYRQIRSVSADVGITIATAKTQVSSIRNQLGDSVSICVEPMRRDTFPAIVLAAAYLHDELGIGGDEPVAVCPVDPYVSADFFQTVIGLDAIVRQGSTNLTLVGIEPTYPSEKYGYIIPADRQTVSGVRQFREKPDRITAEKYIAEGALWNAGVFAFRLDYVLSLGHTILDFTDYRDLYRKYAQLEKISFDYRVVEKEPSIQVIRYAGDWKDVGTWNTISEVMEDNAKGKVLMDETSENTHVINELDIPLLVMGAKGMIVVASGDGILVASKERSAHIKSYVDTISTDVRYADKSWGSYTVIDAGPGSLTAKISLSQGKRMSYHTHAHRDEIWTVLSGRGRAVVDDMTQDLRPGDVLLLASGCRHTILADTDMTVLETQLGEEINVHDKIKYELPAALLAGTTPKER